MDSLPLPAAVIVGGDAHPCMELESCTPGYPPAACPPRARGSARHSRLDLLRKAVQLGGIDWRSLLLFISGILGVDLTGTIARLL